MRGRQLTHDALFYSGDAELVDGLMPFIRHGLENDDALICAVTQANIALLRDHLGSHAERVKFIDRDGWYSRPAVTIAGWQRLLDEAVAAGHDFVRIVGEVAFGDVDRHATWTRYESALNELFAEAPTWIVCPYDKRVLAPRVLADARRTHPGLLDPTRQPSEVYVPTQRLLTEIVDTVPPTPGAPILNMPIGSDAIGLAAVRQAVTNAVGSYEEADRPRMEDLQLIVTELAANSVFHGAGQRRLKLWVSSGGAFTGEVSDEGSGVRDPLAGYQAPAAGTRGGWGLWMSQQLCDRFAISRDGGLTRIRFHISR